jgi:hypothetical protein
MGLVTQGSGANSAFNQVNPIFSNSSVNSTKSNPPLTSSRITPFFNSSMSNQLVTPKTISPSASSNFSVFFNSSSLNQPDTPKTTPASQSTSPLFTTLSDTTIKQGPLPTVTRTSSLESDAIADAASLFLPFVGAESVLSVSGTISAGLSDVSSV